MATVDNYLPCTEYLKGIKHSKFPQFSIYQDSNTNNYYFALLDPSDAILLRSEGYEKKISCENGIKSVLKNSELKERYSVISDGDDYFVILKAGNNKEIARSCDLKTENTAFELIKVLIGESSETVDNLEINQTQTFSIDLSAYLPLNEYLGKDRIIDQFGVTGYSKFKDDKGLFYYVVYNPDGSLYLISRAFTTEIERDNSFDVTESVIVLEENYKIQSSDAGYFAILFEMDEVLAISPSFPSFIEAFTNTPGGRPKEIIGSIFWSNSMEF